MAKEHKEYVPSNKKDYIEPVFAPKEVPGINAPQINQTISIQL